VYEENYTRFAKPLAVVFYAALLFPTSSFGLRRTSWGAAYRQRRYDGYDDKDNKFSLFLVERLSTASNLSCLYDENDDS